MKTVKERLCRFPSNLSKPRAFLLRVDDFARLSLAIEMGADAIDISKTIHPHLTLGESISMAAEVVDGRCTDLPSTRQ